MIFKEIFKPEELVSKKHFETFSNKSDIYELFDDKLKAVIEWLRNELDKPFIANDWSYSKAAKVYNYRGYRWTDCKEGAPNSAHKQGMAIDIIIKGMTAKEFRIWIKEHANELPFPIRVEDGVSWVHIDVKAKEGYKVYFFKP